MNTAQARAATVKRLTRETSLSVVLSLEPGPSDIDSGIGFLDHLLYSLALHGGFSICLHCDGDLALDDHHSVEDCALALGRALSDALGSRDGIARFGWAYAPLDEALARAVVDISGRPYAKVELGLSREKLGELACENVQHFFLSFASAAGLCLHIELLSGQNDHHRAEAAFKAVALALKQAVALKGAGIPSLKGVIEHSGDAV
ncbi:MAG TPA: imidazoleglycerol-phosphate dehydratase HisB [Spirochaetales bacterium]|nr:imidazoleglycerol-phosphate dehydratase HisB [Spirochaetales bacterium]